MPSFEDNFTWQAQYMPEVKQIIGPRLLTAGTLKEDTLEATDLKILYAGGCTIPVRLRRPGYLNYRHEFTITTTPGIGGKSEFDKIAAGFGDIMFYGHVGHDGTIVSWMMFSLKSFRSHLISHYHEVKPKALCKPNGTTFNAYNALLFVREPTFFIDHYHVLAG